MSYDYLDTVLTYLRKKTYNIVFIVDLSYQLISPYEISFNNISSYEYKNLIYK